jgi:hypothetical protein
VRTAVKELRETEMGRTGKTRRGAGCRHNWTDAAAREAATDYDDLVMLLIGVSRKSVIPGLDTTDVP